MARLGRPWPKRHRVLPPTPLHSAAQRSAGSPAQSTMRTNWVGKDQAMTLGPPRLQEHKPGETTGIDPVRVVEETESSGSGRVGGVRLKERSSN